jgi:polyhydroxyalkanoate synthesis regulator phasin
MNEMISRAILSGLGFASLTRDAIRQTAQHLVKRSKLSEDEGRRLVKDFQKRSARAQKVLEKKVNVAVRKALKQVGLERAGTAAKRAAAGAKRAARPTRRKTGRTSKAR